MNIYIPIEIKVREMESRLLLAFEAAERGHDVIIGSKQYTFGLAERGLLKPGIFLEKSLTPGDDKIEKLKLLRQQGHVITCQDEEHGLSVESYDNFAKTRFSNESLKYASKVFCWGSHDIEALKQCFPTFFNVFSNTGSPRVDLWREEFNRFYQEPSIHYGAEFYKARGDYVLISSNFGRILGDKRFWTSIHKLRQSGYFKRGEEEFTRYEVQAWQYQLLGSFISTIRLIAKNYPDLNIVVRPHPTDHKNAWRDLIGDIKNVFVTKKGTISSWIRNSKGVIHNGCTSGTEAFISGRPVLALRTVISEHEKMVPNLLSKQAFTEDDVLEWIAEILKDSVDDQSRIENIHVDLIKQRFTNSKGHFAFEKIVDEWETLNSDELNDQNNWNSLRFRLMKSNLKRNIIQKFRTSNRISSKFPYLYFSEVELIRKGLIKTLGRFGELKVEAFGKDTFKITNAGSSNGK